MSTDSYERMPLALVGVLALFLGAGIAATWFTPAAATTPSLPDLSQAHLVEVRNASGRTVLSGEFRERTDTLGNITRDAVLVDRSGKRVIGEVEINLPGPTAMTTGQELEIDIVEMNPSAKYSVFIDDREVVNFTTDDRGSIDLDLHSAPSEADKS